MNVAESIESFTPGGRRSCLGGVQIMLVEDSRAASEAIRLMAMRSGARIRRADSMKSAERHLKVFRPNVVIIDIGLPDGNGVDLARRVGELLDPRPAVLVISACDATETASAAAAAGADGWLLKPVESMAAFQQAVLAVLSEADESLSNIAPMSGFRPDIRDSANLVSDLDSARDLLLDGIEADDRVQLSYCARFLDGVAAMADDTSLRDCAQKLDEAIQSGGQVADAAETVLTVLRERLMV